MTLHTGCVKFMFKMLGFYNAKLYDFVKLANLAAISKKKFLIQFFLDRHTQLLTYICITDV